MSSQHTDLTFFTNDHNQTLLERFKATLADTRLFDVLVGYFRSSGFYQLWSGADPAGGVFAAPRLGLKRNFLLGEFLYE